MNSKILLKWPLLIFGFLIAIFLVTSSQTQASQKLVKAKSVASVSDAVLAKSKPTQPVLLLIPKINLNISLESVGLTPEGNLGVAKDHKQGAWFDLGPRPGDSGSAVITGHFGYWKNGDAGIFNNLSKLKPGDKLYIKDDTGAMVSFVVRESRKYDPKADALEVFNSSDDKSHLNLITCEGLWNSVSKSYSKRLVVFADKE